MKNIIKTTLLALSCLVPAAYGQSLPILGDSYFAPGNLNNYGTSPTINVGGAGNYQGVVQFDTSVLPAGLTAAGVAKASVVLFVNKVGSPGAVTVNAAIGLWTEGSLNSVNAPSPGFVLASSVAVNAPGVYVTVDATALVKAWLNGSLSEHAVLIAVDPAFPGTSVFFDSKENAGTSHPAMLEVTLVGGGAAGPAGPAGPTGPTGPQGLQGIQGPAGGGGSASLFLRTTFDNGLVPPIISAPAQLATLTFTPSSNGVAELFARGYCNMLPIAGSDNRINIVPGIAAAQAFANSNPSEWGVVNVPAGSVSGLYQPAFSSSIQVSVVANTQYTFGLFGRHEFGASQNDCRGTFTVRVN